MPSRASAVLLTIGFSVAATVVLAAAPWREALAFCRAAYFSSGSNAAARIELPQRRYDFGRVVAGRRLETRFAVHNPGARRLIVRTAGSSCPCAAGENQDLVVEPGQTGQLLARLDTHGLSGPLALELHYATNDPALPRFTLLLMADVHAP